MSNNMTHPILELLNNVKIIPKRIYIDCYASSNKQNSRIEFINRRNKFEIWMRDDLVLIDKIVFETNDKVIMAFSNDDDIDFLTMIESDAVKPLIKNALSNN